MVFNKIFGHRNNVDNSHSINQCVYCCYWGLGLVQTINWAWFITIVRTINWAWFITRCGRICIVKSAQVVSLWEYCIQWRFDKHRTGSYQRVSHIIKENTTKRINYINTDFGNYEYGIYKRKIKRQQNFHLEPTGPMAPIQYKGIVLPV